MKKAVVKRKTPDRRKEKTSLMRELPKCQVCKNRKAKATTTKVVPFEVYICEECLRIYGANPLRKLYE